MIIDVGPNYDIKSINDAIIIAKDYDVIHIHEGLYHEKLKIKKNNLSIIGFGKVIITYSDYALKIHSDGKEYNTFRTYTMLLLGNNITIENLEIRNESGDGREVGQAVSLATLGNDIHINNCLLDAYQDTLFIGPLPFDLIERYQNFLPDDELIYPVPHHVYVNDSTILGDVDFIFGAGTGIFNNCVIISKKRNGYVCAPATEFDDDEGFTFNNCVFFNQDENTKVFLARPWRDYGKVTFNNCLYDNHIVDLGFDKWNDTNRDKTCRFYEYDSSYKDNHNFTRVKWINK